MSEAAPIGYVKLHRQLLNWEWIGDPIVLAVFIQILLRTNREPKRWQGIDIPTGSFFTSRNTLAERCGLTEKQVRRALDVLEQGRTINRVRAGQGLLLSLVKWEEYQESEGKKGRPRADQGPNIGPTEGRMRATTKEVEKERSKEVESAAAQAVSVMLESRKSDFLQACKKAIEAKPDRMLKSERQGFLDYWTEPGKGGKMRFEAEDFFDHGRRMDTWMANYRKRNGPVTIDTEGNAVWNARA